MSQPEAQSMITGVIRQQGIFVSQTLPDISPKSHIIGLVGTTDFEDAASPSEDGWFLSDFYLFNHLFKGLGSSRAWLTCLDPEFLIRKYTEYAHGNSYHTRRIVLSRDQQPTDIRVETPERLLDRFIDRLQETCARAHSVNEPIFLLLFGHGDQETHGVEIGRAENGEIPLLSMDSVKQLLVRFPGLQISVLMTSCFSGGWTTHLNMTVMTAAGPEQESLSWSASQSLGRCTGSIYTSAVLEILAKEDSPAMSSATSSTVILDARQGIPTMDSETKVLSATYQEFADDITAKLLLLDRFGACHDIRFSAQDDDWSREYHERTGIPLAVYKENLEKLRTLPSTDKAAYPYGDRTTDEQLSDWGLPPNPSGSSSLTASLTGRCGGSKRAVERMMQKRVAQYFRSHPGQDEAASNHTAHNLAKKCLSGKCTFEELGKLETILEYRERVNKLVGTLVVVMGLKPFPPPHEWDPSTWNVRTDLSSIIYRKVVGSHLIPKPLASQGRYNHKPTQYLTAAFLANQLSEAEVDGRLEFAKTWAEEQVQEVKMHLSKSFRRRTGTWMNTLRSLRERVRPSSPRKRHQKRLSETLVR
ncbi:MAG: hypothetical protein M1816_005657 [Peltula sp. TS41687]|nr:MAG: hypothetical protein M1816_005657 [Peltula sp. TS41687]